MKFIVPMIVMLTAGACSTIERTVEPQESRRKTAAENKSGGFFDEETFLHSPFEDETLPMPPQVLEDFRVLDGIFDPPEEVEILEKQNRHEPGHTDEIYSIKTGGMVLTYYYVTSKRIAYLESITILAGSPVLKFGIMFGMSENGLVSMCGKPSSRHSYSADRESLFFLLPGIRFRFLCLKAGWRGSTYYITLIETGGPVALSAEPLPSGVECCMERERTSDQV